MCCLYPDRLRASRDAGDPGWMGVLNRSVKQKCSRTAVPALLRVRGSSLRGVCEHSRFPDRAVRRVREHWRRRRRRLPSAPRELSLFGAAIPGSWGGRRTLAAPRAPRRHPTVTPPNSQHSGNSSRMVRGRRSERGDGWLEMRIAIDGSPNLRAIVKEMRRVVCGRCGRRPRPSTEVACPSPRSSCSRFHDARVDPE